MSRLLLQYKRTRLYTLEGSETRYSKTWKCCTMETLINWNKLHCINFRESICVFWDECCLSSLERFEIWVLSKFRMNFWSIHILHNLNLWKFQTWKDYQLNKMFELSGPIPKMYLRSKMHFTHFATVFAIIIDQRGVQLGNWFTDSMKLGSSQMWNHHCMVAKVAEMKELLQNAIGRLGIHTRPFIIALRNWTSPQQR